MVRRMSSLSVRLNFIIYLNSGVTRMWLDDEISVRRTHSFQGPVRPYPGATRSSTTICRSWYGATSGPVAAAHRGLGFGTPPVFALVPDRFERWRQYRPGLDWPRSAQ